jgi:hypothetical protein
MEQDGKVAADEGRGRLGDTEKIIDSINAVFWILRTRVPGETFRRTLEIGKTHTADSAAGGIAVYEKNWSTIYMASQT